MTSKLRKKKAMKAEATSDLSSTDEVAGGRGSRRKVANKRYVSDTEDSDIASNYSDNSEGYPKFRNATALYKSMSFSEQNGTKVMSKPAVSTSEKDEPTQRVLQKVPEKDKNILGDSEFKKVMMQEISLLNLKIDMILDQVRLNRRQEYEVRPDDRKNIETFYTKIPVKSRHDMEDLEQWLADKENYKVAVAELTRIGGISMPQTLRKILYRILTNEVANMYSWDGMKKKGAFKRLMLGKVLLDSVKVSYREETESNIINCTKTWLVKAKERIKYKKNPEPIAEIDE